MNARVAEAASGDGADADGRRTRWSAHRAARRDELIDAAIRAISRHGPNVGMDRIAELAGTSKPVVYRYFTDKTGLHRAVTERVVENILAALRAVTAAAPDPRQLLVASVDAYLTLLEAAPGLYRFVLRHPEVTGADGRTRTFSDVIAGMLDEQLAGQLAGAGLDPARAAPWGEGIVGFISAASLWWLDHPGVMTRAELGAYLAALLWGGAAGVQQATGAAVDARPPAGVFPPAP